MCAQLQESKDVEAAWEIPDQQQAFVCKVYLVIAIQLLLTIIIANAVVISFHPLAYFLMSTRTGLLIYLITSTVMIMAFCLLYYCRFANYLLLGILTITIAFLIGLTCAAAGGKIIVESVIVTTAMVVNLTLFSFWGASRGHDFQSLMPFLFGAIVFTMLFVSVHMIIFPMGKIFVVIHGCLGSIIFCSRIVCVTDSLLMKNFSDNKHTWAAVCLYVEFVNLFLLCFSVFEALHR